MHESGYSVINLFEFAKINECIDGYDDERQTYIVDTMKLHKMLDTYLSTTKGTIILEGHYEEAVPEKYVSKCFVLSCPTGELRLRLNQKGFNEEKIEENLAVEITSDCWINAIETFGSSKVTKIQNMSISDTANLIKTYLHIDLVR